MHTFSSRQYLVYFLITLLVTATSALASVLPEHLPSFQENGGFQVYIEHEGQWSRIGFLAFDDFFREKSLTLAPHKEKIHLRLVKKGNGVAHIDRILLGGKAAVAVSGVKDSGPLSKLAAKDFDVIHLPEGKAAIELTFTGGRQLTLAARVEGARLDDTPFQFPRENLRQDITTASRFFRYDPSGKPTEIFSETTVPGTGHPEGKTSVIGRLQGDRLELVMDFEPDNTLDGNKDYASVHVRQGKIVRTYTVSQDNGKWGHPYFTYTSRVPWQHKVYRFSLPLAELQFDSQSHLELAFSAYGTAGPGPYSPISAYGSGNNEYLSVETFFSDPVTSVIQSRLFSPKGEAVGAPHSITSQDSEGKIEAAVAYDSVNNQFLSLWVQTNGAVGKIHRQLVSPANTSVGNLHIFSSLLGRRYPHAAYSTKSKRYLVIWSEQNGSLGSWWLKGYLINSDNTDYSSSSIKICPQTANPGTQGGHIAYNPLDDVFLVVWKDSRNQTTTGTDVYGRLVGADGSLHGISTSINSGPGGQFSPDIAFDPDHNRSLVVWQDSRNSATSGEDIYGQFLGNGLMKQGNTLTISAAAGDQWGPRVGYAGHGRFLVIWQDRSIPSHSSLKGRWISKSGEMLGEELVFAKLVDGEIMSPELAGDGRGNFLSVYNTLTVADGVQIGATRIVDPYSSNIFLLALPAFINGGDH